MLSTRRGSIMSNKELIERLRFLEAYECELAASTSSEADRDMHFRKAAYHAARLVALKRQTLGRAHMPFVE